MNSLQRELVRTVQLYAIDHELTWFHRLYIGRVLRALRRGS